MPARFVPRCRLGALRRGRMMGSLVQAVKLSRDWGQACGFSNPPLQRGRLEPFLLAGRGSAFVLLTEPGEDTEVLQGRGVLGRVLAAGDVAQQPAHDLA